MEKPTVKICKEKTLIMKKPILGIIGGGQLGSLLSVAAKKLEIKTVIFSDDPAAPAQHFADNFICGDYKDKKNIKFPPIISPCPDHWDISGNLCINSNNTGETMDFNDF